MALQLASQLLVLIRPSPTAASQKSSSYPQIKPASIFIHPILKHSKITTTPKRKTTRLTIKSTPSEEEDTPSNDNNIPEPQPFSDRKIAPDEPQLPTNGTTTTSQISELGLEIRKAIEERGGRDGGGGRGGFWGGVAEEIREIEWPGVGKELGTIGDSSRFGVPKIIVTDNEKQFDNRRFRGFCVD
ncbi:hypothetical protein U1Q18_031230 [Sarracenia purpurea var. burkii]